MNLNSTKKSLALFAGLALGATAMAQTAQVQIVHNCADAAAAVVDIYANDDLLLDDVAFRTATAFLDLTAGVDIDLDITVGTDIDNSTPVFSTTVNFAADETYIVVADGIVVADNYNPAPAFGLQVFDMGRTEASMMMNTDVLVHHGSTDAPVVDVAEVGVGAGVIVNDASYPMFAGYLELATADYELAVQTSDNSVTVDTYAAPLSTLGLDGQALMVMASGFLDPSVNNNGAAFGLFAVLATGDVVELPLVLPPTAQVQIVHNCADAAAAVVDVYADDALLLDDVAFRTATAFLDLPAGVDIDLDITAGTAMDNSSPVFSTTVNFDEDGTYIVVADGIVVAADYNPAPAFGLQVFDMGRTEASMQVNTDVLVHHGSTDAPTVDVAEVGVGAGVIVDDASYPMFAGYLELANADYQLAVQTSDNAVTVATYDAPLATLGLDGEALMVMASGFLDPSVNNNGAAFGLFAVLADGTVVELPLSPTPFTNDDICDAISLSTDGTVVVVDNTGATVQAGEDALTPEQTGCGTQDGWCGNESGIDNSMWFNFVATGNVAIINTCEEGNTVDTQVALFSGTDCADFSTLTFLGANDDGPACTTGENPSQFASNLTVSGLTVGETYWILVDGYDSDEGNVGISVVNQNFARLQIIHNSADAAAAEVDVWINGALALDNVPFRAATNFGDVPAGVDLTFAITGPDAPNADAPLVSATVNLDASSTYIVIANGIASGSGYSPAPPLSLDIFDMGREVATVATNTDVLVFHGSTDAPTVDVAEVGVGAGVIVDDASYGDFAGYLELGAIDYQLAVQTSDNAVTVATYEAPLSGFEGQAITVLASGFLDPSVNSDGDAFGLFVAVAEGGLLIELPLVTGLDEYEDVAVSTFPNPASDVINVNFAETMVGNLQIIDLAGKVVATQAINGPNAVIDLANVAPGFYTLLAITADKKAATRIIVE